MHLVIVFEHLFGIKAPSLSHDVVFLCYNRWLQICYGPKQACVSYIWVMSVLLVFWMDQDVFESVCEMHGSGQIMFEGYTREEGIMQDNRNFTIFSSWCWCKQLKHYSLLFLLLDAIFFLHFILSGSPKWKTYCRNNWKWCWTTSCK